MQQIKFTEGCPNNCEYCYEPKELKIYDPKIPTGEKLIQISDMNFLANPKHEEIMEELMGTQNRSYELICGVDYRLLNQDLCNFLHNARFIKMRWAWDYNFGQQRIHRRVLKMFLKAGYKPKELSVFILVNWKTDYETCCKKLDLLKVWNVKVNDCCFDGGYPKSEIDFNKDKRFNNKRFWNYSKIKKFRDKCRTHNQMVLFKIDPEFK